MGTIADIESRGGATVYRFSDSSIRRGLDHGKTGDQIKTFLSKISKTPMPQPLEYLITDIAKRHGRLRVGSAHTYIRCEDEGLVQQILHDKKCEHLRLRKIAPQVLVTEFELTEVIGELREYGYLPAAENAGGVLLSQPNLRRAKSRPKPPRIISEFSAPKDAIVLSAVKEEEFIINKICTCYAHMGSDVVWPGNDNPMIVTITSVKNKTVSFCTTNYLKAKP
mgnify:CR=1 FL=1